MEILYKEVGFTVSHFQKLQLNFKRTIYQDINNDLFLVLEETFQKLPCLKFSIIKNQEKKYQN